MALTELARYLPRNEHRNRYLRQGIRPHATLSQTCADMPDASFEMPPGATLSPTHRSDMTMRKSPDFDTVSLVAEALHGAGVDRCAVAAQAQALVDDPDWKETEVPAPPAFSTRPAGCHRDAALRELEVWC